MAFLNTNQAIVAFKQLLGKSNTDVAKEAGNEAEGIFFNIPAAKVWMDAIDPTPSVSVTLGVAVQVTATMVVDGTSNGHALFATWPVAPPSGTDPLTAAPFSYGTGSLTGILSGDRVRNAISPSYGSGYEAKPYAGLNLISPGDPRDWIYQYNSGVFFQQDGSGDIPAYGGSAYTNPTTIQVYVYIGETLDNFSGGGGGGSSEWYDSVLTIQNTPPGSPITGARYLIDATATGAWTGQDDKIAEWNGAAWVYTVPTTGGTVLVDDEIGYVFIYSGTYPTGTWNMIPFSTTRAGVATGTDTYSLTVSPPILAYDTNLLILATFVNNNTGASTLNVNALGAVSLLKSDGIGGLTALVADDIRAGLIYMIMYDGFTFQVFLGASNYIPLTGTQPGFPVSGDIEVIAGTKIFSSGSPSSPGVKFEMDNILVDGSVAKYDSDRTAEFDALTLVTKGYVDSVTGAPPTGNVSVSATYIGTGGSPVLDSYDGVSSPAITGYDGSVIYLVTFNSDNTGPAQLSIDGQPYFELMKGDETLGLISLAAGDIQNSVIYYVVFDGTGFQLFSLNPAPVPGTYTNLNPSTIAVGGVPVGTTFNNTTYKQIYDMMFYPYVLPTFTAFSISGQATSLEVGQNISAGSKTFLWTTTNQMNIKLNTLTIRDMTTLAYIGTNMKVVVSSGPLVIGRVYTILTFGAGDNFTNVGATSNAVNTIFTASGTTPSSWSYGSTLGYDDGTENINFASPITRTSQGTRVWRIYGTRTNSSTFTKDFTVGWYWRVFSGTSTNTTLTEPQIEALVNNGLQSSFPSTITYAAGGFKYFCIPTVFGYPALFKDVNTNLNVAMAGVAEGYTGTNGNGIYYQTVSVTNAYGQTINYRVYRTLNILGGTIKIAIT